jgi:hypothetical protein
MKDSKGQRKIRGQNAQTVLVTGMKVKDQF